MREYKAESNSNHEQHIDEKPFRQKTFEVENEAHFSLKELFAGIFSKIHPLFSIDSSVLVLYDVSKEYIKKAYFAELNSDGAPTCIEMISSPLALDLITGEIAGFDFPVLKSRQEWLSDFGENHCLNSHPADYSFHCYIPLEINGQVLGTLELHNNHKELSPEGLTFCCNIADFLSGLLSIIHSRTESDSSQLKSLHDPALIIANQAQESDLLQFLNGLNNAKDINQLLLFIAKDFKNKLQADIATSITDVNFPLDLSLGKPFRFEELNDFFLEYAAFNTWFKADLQSIIVLPVVIADNIETYIFLGFSVEHATVETRQFSVHLTLAAVVLANLKLKQTLRQQDHDIAHYRDSLTEFESYSADETDEVRCHHEIVGSCMEMQQVFKLLERISSSETTVLILGETGTGKELIAKAIHDGSDRKDKVMIKVNCAAIPPNLIESELFGHEKGSFTGATEKRIGKFEQAHQATLFLDEVGELPLDLQVKLLRVLQEKEIERIGGKSTIFTDVRIISATNRNLLSEVENGTFRRDLYYRLNVFPIALPPLRKRRADIPELAHYFLEKYAKKLHKKLDGFTKKAISTMMTYSWPGNVRELEHLIERQVVMVQGGMIREIEIPQISKDADTTSLVTVKTIFENERDHIFSVLELCNGKISGPNGAAKLLGVPATTLNSKIKRLGLAKKHII